MEKFGRCTNVGNCELADKKELIPIPPGAAPTCPKDGSPLMIVESPSPPMTKKIIAAIVALLLLIGGWWWLQRQPPMDPDPPKDKDVLSQPTMDPNPPKDKDVPKGAIPIPDRDDSKHLTLTVTKGGNGAGTITSTPSGIDCGTSCTHDYAPGSVISLSATPGGGATFAGWSGACNGTGPCQLTMNNPKGVSVTGTFGDNTAVLSCSESRLVRKESNDFIAVEVGSSGVKTGRVEQMDLPGEGREVTFVSRGEPLESKNVFPREPGTQEITVYTVLGFIQELQTKFSLPCEHIVIYGSSGLSQEAHKDMLAKKIQERTGRVMAYITAKQEAFWTLMGTVPRWRKKEVISIDVGSNNIKGGYLAGGNEEDMAAFAIPLGTKAFTAEIQKACNQCQYEPGKEKAFVEAMEKVKREKLLPQIEEALRRNPGLQTLPRVYLSGGITWTLANLIQPCPPKEQMIPMPKGDISVYLPLSAEDITTFYDKVHKNPLFEPDYSACDVARKAEITAEVLKAAKLFGPENRIAGAEILRALSEKLQFSRKDRIFFARYAQTAVMVGYLQEQLENAQRGDVLR